MLLLSMMFLSMNEPRDGGNAGRKIGGERGSPPGGVRLRFFWVCQAAQVQLPVQQVYR
jgi:hypothetical protein